MRPITGVRVKGNGLQHNQYRCRRCGIENTYNLTRTRPVWCSDCKTVDTPVALNAL